jgi:hypothetical protein
MEASNTQMNRTTPNSTDSHIVYPKVLLTMLERAQAENKRLHELAATWRTIADNLVYTEHDDYKHYHLNKLNPCERCEAHDQYHSQVSIDDNPGTPILEDGEDEL